MTERITTVEQHPADLHLYVFTQAAPHNLRILKQHHETIPTPGGLLQVAFSVVGESHMVTLRQAGRFMLREVLACVRLTDPPHCLHQHACDGLTAHQFATDRYQVALSFNAPPWPLPVTRDSGAGRLSVAFPEIWGRIPVTEMRWHAAPDRLRWWTLHTYPHEGGVQQVYSASHVLF